MNISKRYQLATEKGKIWIRSRSWVLKILSWFGLCQPTSFHVMIGETLKEMVWFRGVDSWVCRVNEYITITIYRQPNKKYLVKFLNKNKEENIETLQHAKDIAREILVKYILDFLDSKKW